MAVQTEQLGTGHAVRMAEDALAGFDGDVLILYGDVPVVKTATMRRMIDALHGGTAGGIKQTVERIGAALGNAMVVGVFFGLVPLGWTTAFTGAYLAITLFVLAALVLAVVDERQHSAPVA